MKIQIQQLDTKNKNGRVYPKAVMEKAIEDFKNRGTPLLGTLGVQPGPAVNVADVAFMVEDLHIEGDYVVGTAKVLQTPKGTVLNEMLKSDLAFRPAGIGTVEDGVIKDYTISYISVMPASDAS